MTQIYWYVLYQMMAFKVNYKVLKFDNICNDSSVST